MAGEGSKKDMGFVLTQAMRAGNSVRAQRDRLLQLQRRLQRLQAGPAAQDHNARLGVLATDLFKVYFVGLGYGARTLTTCIRFARQQGVLLSPPTMDFAVMSDEQLHDALLALAQQFPARPTTRTQAIDRAMAALLAIKLLEEHLLPRCVECLVGGKAPVPGKLRDPCPGPIAAATEGLARVDLSDDPDAKTGSKPRHADAARGGGGEVDKALDYMYRASRIVSLAVKHIDVAVAVLSRFLDPKKLASLTELCDDHVYISEDGPYPSSD